MLRTRAVHERCEKSSVSHGWLHMLRCLKIKSKEERRIQKFPKEITFASFHMLNKPVRHCVCVCVCVCVRVFMFMFMSMCIGRNPFSFVDFLLFAFR